MVGPKLNYIVDMLMVLAFAVTATSAFLFFFNLFGGSKEFLGIQRGDLSFWHRWVGLAFIMLVATHFVLHWGWITAMTKNMFYKKQ